MELELGAGEVRWLEAQEHSGENIGTTDTASIFVELKDFQPPPRQTTTGTLGPLPPG